MKPISDQALARLQAIARNGDAISTAQVREVLDLSVQQYHRLSWQVNYPKPQRISREWWLNPVQLLAFCQEYNRLARAATITEVAALLHCTIPTARRNTRQPGFPAKLGEVNGHDKWDRAEIIEWHRHRLGGAKLPPHTDADPEKSKRATRAKGTRSGKAKVKAVA